MITLITFSPQPANAVPTGRTTSATRHRGQAPPGRHKPPWCLGVLVVASPSRGQSWLATFEHCQPVRALATPPKPLPDPASRTLPTRGGALGNVGNLHLPARFSRGSETLPQPTASDWRCAGPGAGAAGSVTLRGLASWRLVPTSTSRHTCTQTARSQGTPT